MTHTRTSFLAQSINMVLFASALGASTHLVAAEEEQERKGIEVINITAQKRVENLQEVPMSMTAFSAEAIEKNQLTDIGDIAAVTPNFSFSTTGSGRPEFTIRGIGTSGVVRAGLDNAVNTFVDDVYISRSSSSIFELFDLESISVLRGPQGTLFGKNVVGGAISINTKKPTEDLEMKIKGGVGSEGLRTVQAYINGGLTDELAGKLTVSTNQRDGLGYDTASGQELADRDSKSVRGQLYFDNGDFTTLFTADYSRDKNNGQIISERGLGSLAATDNDRFTSSHGIPQSVDSKIYGFSLKAETEIDSGLITSVSAIRKNSLATVESFTAEQLNVDNGNRTGTQKIPGLADIFDNSESSTQITQEFRFTSNTDTDLAWVSGVFFIKEEINRIECEEVYVNGTQPVFIGGGAAGKSRPCWDNTNDTTGLAFFWDGSYDLTDSVKIRVGARYTQEEKENYIEATYNETLLDQYVPGAENLPDAQLTFPLSEAYTAKANKSFSGFTPRFVIEWTPSDDLLTYFNVSKGFKSGGFDGKVNSNNLTAEGIGKAERPFDEETAINYELGLKSQWFDDRLRVNTALFQSNFDDMQRLIIVPAGGLAVVNAASATSKGLELDGVALLTDDWELNFGYGFLRATFDEFVINANDDRSGQVLPNAPKHKFNLGSTYTHTLENDGTVTFYASYGFTASQHFNRAPIANLETQGAYNVYNANISYTTPDENWKFTLWGKNITDTEYSNKLGQFIESTKENPADPATYGISVTYNYF
ncbi:TonB-dependent receptor [Paraglaciecola sp. T6c]|uniref:TonB-dependent receptor n=1 Tax=Pseudoalteromonas atlantica (strain T6c / ATCC BAA-1087) TaxID=3042615 RepID=UPI00005C61CA|nr:TonB-dependent receptor [Paraglaciecola sp. T6c]ABG42404.1 TonB-dependent receptor [Paraglaciecola sp. T6c]